MSIVNMEMNVHHVTEDQFTEYSEFSVTINHKEFKSSILVANSKIYPLLIQNIKELYPKIITDIIELNHDIILFGTCNQIIYPNDDLINFLRKNLIGMEVMTIPALCRTYNFLVSEGRKVICILIF